MRTDELITRLADRPLRGRPPATVLAGALGAGMIASLAILLVWLGPRADMAQAIWTAAFWMKLAYAASLAAIAFEITARLSRPAGALQNSAILLTVPVLVLVLLAFVELRSAAPEQRMPMLMGHSANSCPWRIVALSLPILVAVFFGLRRLAPTRLMLTGAAAGLLAGAAGTAVYAIFCNETAAPFVAIWYTLGMIAVGALGGLFGRELLRW
jgi:hypothetical protein